MQHLRPETVAQLRAEGGPIFVAQLAALLARTVPARLAVIHHGAETGDPAGIARAAHSLRSSAANLGADALAGAADALEHAARELAAPSESPQRTADLAAHVSAVDEAWADVADEVRQLARTA